MSPQHLNQAIEALKDLEQRISAGMQVDDQTQALLQDTLVLLLQERLIDEVDAPEEVPWDFGAQFDQVLEAFEQAGEVLEAQFDRLRMHLNVGDTLYRLGRWQEAQSHYEAAQKVAEEGSEDLSFAGSCVSGPGTG